MQRIARFLGPAILIGLPLAGSVAAATSIVNDVTQLNPIVVETIVAPHSTEEVSALVRTQPGPVSIGGGRFSMGGQIATDNAFFIDMRDMNRVLAFHPEQKTVTVQAGITWKDLQQAIDPANLSVKIMQTYHNFTVGGSLSVNCHGRYVGYGPLITSVRSFTIVLADGSIVQASPTEHADLFYGAIGGYGALGVITEVTLELADNMKVRRDVHVMPIGEYKTFFFANIRNNIDIVFSNAHIYPPAYDTVGSITWSRTDDPLTIANRLQPENQNYGTERFLLAWVSESLLGLWTRQHILDPYLHRNTVVEWRNYEAGYDVKQLEPASRQDSTYVLEEYFVPVDRFYDFIPTMREILQRHHVNMINISIRHALQDPGSVMAWARSEVFCFVMYYKQETSKAATAEVGDWTREMIDAALSLGGSYYLPYQLHATPEQFRRAYPDADKFFALKEKYDPRYKFRNKLWDKYDPPDAAGRASANVAP